MDCVPGFFVVDKLRRYREKAALEALFRSVGVCTRRIFPSFGSLKSSDVQSVGNTQCCEIDGGIVSSDNRCQNSFPLTRAELFSFWMPRMKIRSPLYFRLLLPVCRLPVLRTQTGAGTGREELWVASPELHSQGSRG